MNILLGVTGSVATTKIDVIIALLKERAPKDARDDLKVELVATDAALKFFDVDQISKHTKVHTDASEWSQWKTRSDPISHIQLRNWADIFCICPLDANTLAKIANGLCDNLLTCVARAWDPSQMQYFVVCPAMNTFMWEHPITRQHFDTITSWGIQVIPPVKKKLACGDTGIGGLEDARIILSEIWELLLSKKRPPDNVLELGRTSYNTG